MGSVSTIITLFILIFGAFLLYTAFKKKKWKEFKGDFPPEWRDTLIKYVEFYRKLNPDDKQRFEKEVGELMMNVQFTGVKTSLEEEEAVLISASAVIPVFGFPEWRYENLVEVLLYPNRFADDFGTEGEDRNILGMVGTGYMEGKMILSKPALYHGFSNETDKRNTAVHEFAHLVDKADGRIDGVPSLLIAEPNVIPWISMMDKEIEAIRNQDSNIAAYGGVSREEFFAVISEYFFERPGLLKQQHPELYSSLSKIFAQHPKPGRNNRKKTGRNDPCPCQSGKKFKHCCGKGR